MRQWLARITLLILLTWLSLEIVARLWEQRPVQVAVAESGRVDNERFPPGLFETTTRLTPNFDGVALTGIRYTTNSLGYRDDEINPAKQLWLFLGDSTTFGLNIQHEDMYTERVESQVNQGTQAVNAAVVSWSTLDELNALNRLLDKGYRFEWVIVGVFANDPIDTWNGIERQRQRTIWQHSALYRVLDSFLQNQRSSAVNTRWRDITHTPDFWGKTAAQAFRPVLDELVTTAQDSGAQVALLYIPLDAPEVLNHSYMDDGLREYAVERGIVYISGVMLYRDYLNQHGLTDIPESFYSWPGDMGHPSPLTSGLLAHGIGESLAS